MNGNQIQAIVIQKLGPRGPAGAPGPSWLGDLPITVYDDYPLQSQDGEVLGDATAGDFNLFLPLAVGSNKAYHTKKIDPTPFVVNVVAAGNDNIDGADSVTLANQYADALLIDAAPGYWDYFGPSFSNAITDDTNYSGFRIKDDGSFQLFNPTQSLYFTILLTGDVGSETLQIVTPGEP